MDYETLFDITYGRWPKPAELKRFIKYGQKTKPKRAKSKKRKTARR